jgi:glycosyltransferase involved in cell wall biosynthesis
VRILIVSQYFHPEIFRVNHLATALRDGGHDVRVVTGQPNYPAGRFFAGYGPFRPSRESYRGIEVTRVPIFPRGRARSWELALNYLSFAMSATLFGLLRLRGRFDATIVFCPSPITAAIPAIVYRFFRGTPVALWVQDLWPETVFAILQNRNTLLGRAIEVLVRWIYRHVDQIWIQSPAYRASVCAHGGSSAKIRDVVNWAEDLYDRERWVDVASDNVPENSIVFAGNLGRAQGLETLIDAAEATSRMLPSPHWIFVGDGALRDWLEKEVRGRGLEHHVTLLPRRAPHDMPRILKPATALVITLGVQDVFAKTIPSKVQSCLAAGRPIIGVLSGEGARIIEEANCGYVCPPGDCEALARIIERFMALPQDKRDELGRNGHHYYKAHFTERRVISQVAELLNEMQRVGTQPVESPAP